MSPQSYNHASRMALTPDAPKVEARPHRRLTAEHATARALVEASSFAEATPKILQAICESLGWEHGALWTVDRDQNVLRCSDIWTAPGGSFEEFDAHQPPAHVRSRRGTAGARLGERRTGVDS